MEEFTILQSMFKILNSSNSKKKKAIIEALPILLDTYDIHGEIEVYNLIVSSTQNICFQIVNTFENTTWKDSDVSLDDLKSMFIYFINIIKKHSSSDVIHLFQHCVELFYNVDYENCSNEKIINIGFCLHNLNILCNCKINNNIHFNSIRNSLTNMLNEQNLNKNKLDAIIMILNNIVSINDIPTLWNKIKSMIETHPDHLMYLLFNMQCLFFDTMCVSVILNDDDFWSLSCNLLTCENNVIRTYNNVILKLACSLLSNENVTYCPIKSKEQFIKELNDYLVVMEILENTQQHLTLPILSMAKNLVLNKSDDCKLPLKWITAMYCKMSKHSSKYVILASIDIITNMSILSLKTDEKLLQSFINSLNNVFLYKMSSELNIDQPQLEIILSIWFDKLIVSNDGFDIFSTFLSYIPTVQWSIVPLIFLSKSLVNINSSKFSMSFNIINHVLKMKHTIMKMPNSYLKSIVLSFLFMFTCKFFAHCSTEICCDLFDIIIVCQKSTKSWDYIMNSIRKINDLNSLDEQLSQRINEKHKMYSTSIGLFLLSNIFTNYPICVKKLDNICFNIDTVDISDLTDILVCLLEVESGFNKYDTCVSQILDKHVWSLTTLWINKCLEKTLCDDSIICSFLDKVLTSNRIPDTQKIMNIWLQKCYSILINHSGNYNILAIYSWIGKYATKYSSDHTLKNDWLSFTKYFIISGFFSLQHQDFFHLKKPRMLQIPQLDIITTFFKHSTVSDEQMLDLFYWLTEKTIERYDNYWSIYFSTAETFFCKFQIEVNLEKIIQFIKNCWEFLVNCRVSCFPNATKSFIKLLFQYNLISEQKYVTFLREEIIQNLLIETYSEKFSVCFSLFLLRFFEDQSDKTIQILESQLIVSEFFAKCILFSIDRYGAVKIEWDTIEYVRSLNNFPLISDISVESLPDDKYLRFNTIKCLKNMNSNILWKNVLNSMIKTETSLKDRKYFHNSKAYRIKQRVVHILLIIACDIKHKSLIFENNVYKWSLSSLKEVSHIHSVAYQLIWLLVLIYNKYHEYSDFWNDFKNAEENHNYLCCFISIIYHLHKIEKNKQFQIDTKKYLLPLCFSNGYKIRFYAQTIMCKLFPCNSKDSEWSLVWNTMYNIITKYEQTKKYENPFNDFFYKELDMANSLCLKNVCVEVPRLLNIVYEERFPLKWLNDFLEPSNNGKYDLSTCLVSSFIEKNTTSALSNEIIVLDNAQNAQRKYIPSQPTDESSTNSMLIVVASLIDKVTNLGGLARTCQVFGASTLVIDSLPCIEKKEFTALSMTAEKHLCIIEVKVKNLKSYLHKKKNEGYQIVAAEQTIDSVKLHDVKLPFKCVLLLGNETSGIPHDLLSVMDMCVEIKQLGIVRSLNVHVAGSLFIWEYAKQHCLTISN